VSVKGEDSMENFKCDVRLNNERIKKLQKLREWSGLGKQAIFNTLIDQAYDNAARTMGATKK
jgi:hypothetical protein